MTDKKSIENILSAFSTENAILLFQTLGYDTSRKLNLENPTFEDFKAQYVEQNLDRFDENKALCKEWEYIDMLFQLTEQELKPQIAGFQNKQVDNTIMESYLFFVLKLSKESYTRTQLTDITRQINRLFSIPVMVLFEYGNQNTPILTLSVINRRINQIDDTKDVLEKVTQIKDINTQKPHRAHIDILFDLSFDELKNKYNFTNFVELHNAWRKVLDTEELNTRFFGEIANWYFWAVENVKFGIVDDKTQEETNKKAIIQLLSRVIFVWFLKQKNLINNDFFDEKQLYQILKDFQPQIPEEGLFASKSGNKNKIDNTTTENTENTYYKAILQNLFFATLNKPILVRGFALNAGFPQNKATNSVNDLYRYETLFKNHQEDNKKDSTLEIIQLFAKIPFLNGGLFDSLDKKDKTQFADGFTRNPKHQPNVPDYLFFSDETKSFTKKLGEIYETKAKEYKVKGLIQILDNYKFTVEENTPTEEEIALDPELLGQIFENLLAYYNPETGTTARKGTGSFYTPREIVAYMVQESLMTYLKNKIVDYANQGKGFVTHIPDSQQDMFKPKAIQTQLASLPKITDKQIQEIESKLRTLFEESINTVNNHPQPLLVKEGSLSPALEGGIRGGFDTTQVFSIEERKILLKTIYELKILDPACGSGAFPMGALYEMVKVLKKIDPENEFFRELIIKQTKATKDKLTAQLQNDKETVKLLSNEEIIKQATDIINKKIEQINNDFDEKLNTSDYARKLYLIKECIYGVDIQATAAQITKLRFFIALFIEQKTTQNPDDNFGIEPLPNLETNIIIANTLISPDKPKQQMDFLENDKIILENERKKLRNEYFDANTKSKKYEIRNKENDIATQLITFFKNKIDEQNREQERIITFQKEAQKHLKINEKAYNNTQNAINQAEFNIKQSNTDLRHFSEMAGWTPYEASKQATWFDADWMFGIKKGFDIVIGNPPYVRADAPSIADVRKQIMQTNQKYQTLWEKWDLYVAFIEKGYQILAPNGILSYIIPDAYMASKYAQKSHEYFIKNASITRVNFLAEIKVFKAAVKNIIIEFRNAPNAQHKPKRVRHTETFKNQIVLNTDFQQELQEKTFKLNTEKKLLGNLDNTIKWENICYVSYGLRPSSDEKFHKGEFVKDDLISDVEDNTHPKPYIEAKWIKKYEVQKVKYLEWGTARSPHQLVRQTFPELYVPAKILRGRMTSGIYDESGLLCNDSCFVSVLWESLSKVENLSINNSVRKDFEVKGDKSALKHFRSDLSKVSKGFNLKYLLGILNSKLGYYYLNSFRRSQLGFYPDDLKQLPIKVISLELQQPFIKLVEEIMAKKAIGENTQKLEDELDVLVYALYDFPTP